MSTLVWEKIGKIFNPHEQPTPDWMHSFAQAPATLIFEKFVRVYFSCRPPADSNGQFVSYSTFLDLDRKDLTRIINIAQEPILELGSLGTFDEFGIYPFSIIRNDNKIDAYYAGWTRCESVPFNVAIGKAVSEDDGKTFTKIGNGPLISYTPDEPFVISGPKIRKFNNKWYLFYISGTKWIDDNGKPEPVYKIKCAISQDGLNFTKCNKFLIDSKLEENEAQASPDVFFYNHQYHMFFCYRYSRDYRNSKNGYRIGYATSNNLMDWYRNDDKVGIDVSKENTWDSEMIAYPHIFELDEDIYMLYLGNGVGRTGFGLAKLKNKNEL